MQDILISFIMAVYNNERYVSAAIESLINQEGESYELIVVDDGSTDLTSKIVDDFARKYSQIRVIHQDNQWIYASFNNGIRLAKGEYIYILNSDDKLAHGSLKQIEQAIYKYNFPDVLWTKVCICDCDENQIVRNKRDINPKVTHNKYFEEMQKDEESWLWLLESNLLNNQANLYKKSLVEQHLFRNDYYGADYLFNLELAKWINRSAVLSREIYLFYLYEDKEMNISNAKYYGYEHNMANEFYKYGINLANQFANGQKLRSFFENQRRSWYSKEIHLVLNNDKDMLLEKRLQIVFEESVDYVVEEVFRKNREELEARLFSELRKVFLDEELRVGSPYFFVYRMLCILTQYEKEENELEILKDCVNCELNPNRIGKVFYSKLVEAKNGNIISKK